MNNLQKATALYGNPEGTDKLNSSSQMNSDESTWHFPETRKKALELKDLGIKISLPKDMLNNLISYFQTIGADKDLPTGKKEKFGYLNRFHFQLAVNNPLWPTDLPFGFVYGSFLNKIIYGDIKLNGFNIKAHVDAFRQWITGNGATENLYRSYYNQHPEKEPKKLTGNTREPKEAEYLEAGLVNETPEEVYRIIENLEEMYGRKDQVLKAFSGFKNYAERLYATRDKYQSEGNWTFN